MLMLTTYSVILLFKAGMELSDFKAFLSNSGYGQDEI